MKMPDDREIRRKPATSTLDVKSPRCEQEKGGFPTASNASPMSPASAGVGPSLSSDIKLTTAIEGHRLDNQSPSEGCAPAFVDPGSCVALSASVVAKHDFRLMPFVFLGLLLFWLDRSNIALARINGLETDLNLRGAEYNLANMAFVVSYIVFTLPGNLMLRRLGGGRSLPGITVAWGLVTLGSGFVTSFGELCVTRVILGVAEAGFMGGALLYLGFFYTSEELTARIGVFFASTPLSGTIGALLAAALGQISSNGLRRWPWIFIIEGILTVLLGAGAFFVLPDTPIDATFLSGEEKEVAAWRMRLQDHWHFKQHVHPAVSLPATACNPHHGIDYCAPAHDHLQRNTFRRAFVHPMTLLMTAGAFFTICALYSYTLFLPTIISAMGYQSLKATLMTAPPNVSGAIFCIFATQWSQRTGRFAVPLIASSFLTAAGYSMLLAGSLAARPGKVLSGLQYAGTFGVAMGVSALSPLAMAWVSLNAAPHYVRAIVLGVITMLGSFGGVVASFAYIKTEEPKYIYGHSINLAFSFATILVGIAVIVWMKRENQKRDKGLRDHWLSDTNRAGLTREQHEIQLGWRHPHFRFKI